MRISPRGAVVAIVAVPYLQVVSSTTVSISQGTVTGAKCEGNRNAVAYKSIPYAKPPTGELRFFPPEPLRKFPGGSVDGTKVAPSCIQFAELLSQPPPISEDCLYLNIYAPANATLRSELPVRVWMYGGFNTVGGISDPMYDGCDAASGTDAVLVNINYRLGPLGFMALTSAGIGGNMGIQDVLLGLQWVQDNIAAFGGSPGKVMLHGQSAGAVDGFIIATLPQAPRLIGSAILQSGAGRDVPSLGKANALGARYAERLSCGTSDISCLQTKPVSELISAFGAFTTRYTYPLVSVANLTETSLSGACIDGKVITHQPSAQPLRVPSVVGTTSLEGTIFALLQFADPSRVTESDYDVFLNESFGPVGAALVRQAYPLSRFESIVDAASQPPSIFPPQNVLSPPSSSPSSLAPFYTISAIRGQASFVCAGRRVLEITAASGVPVWTYRFQHSPECPWLPADLFPSLSDGPNGSSSLLRTILGPTHTAELPFIFAHTGSLPLPDGTCEMGPAEKALGRFLSGAWTEMARSKRPTVLPAAAGTRAMGKGNKVEVVKEVIEWPEWGDTRRSLGLTIADGGALVPGYMDFTFCETLDRVHELGLFEAIEEREGRQHGEL